MFFRKQQDPKLEDRLRGLSGEPEPTISSAIFDRGSLEPRPHYDALTACRRRGRHNGLMLIPFAAFGGVGSQVRPPRPLPSLWAATTRATASGQQEQGQRQLGQQQQGQRQRGDTIKGNGNAGDHDKGHGNKPDDDQYKPGKGCGDKNHEHARNDECKKPAN